MKFVGELGMIAGIFGGWEMVLMATVAVILIGARKLPDLARGLGEAARRFHEATDDVAHDAGQSLGGIHGKLAAQALTPDNHTAEIYDPKLWRKHAGGRGAWRRRRWRRLLQWLRRFWRGSRTVRRTDRP